MPKNRVQHTLDTPNETCLLAQAFACQLEKGDVILLAGRVGAGKTHFARCLIQSLLEAPEDVPSPTYTLVQTYECAAGEIWHADLYRLTDLSEVDELGLMQAFTDAISLVEWPERLGDQIPANALTLTFEDPFGDDRRRVTAEWSNPSWGERVKQVMNV